SHRSPLSYPIDTRWGGFRQNPSRGPSEFLLEGTDLEFHGPRARILMRQMPVGLGDRLGLEKVALCQARLESPRPRDVDAPVHVDPRHVDPLRTEVASE